METLPLVSVIVVTYNSSKYVLETLESILAQTYDNIELIISDDGSKDDTVKICRQWLSNQPGRFVHVDLLEVEKNTGIPANCNRGAGKASGQWLKFIAADDTLSPTCIEDNVKIVLKNNAIQALQTNLDVYKNDFTEGAYIATTTLQQRKMYSLQASASEQYRLMLKKNSVKAPSMFLRKELLTEVGGFDERIPLIEDWPFWTKVTQRNHKIHFNPVVTVNYRKHVDSVILAGGKIMSTNYAKNLLLFGKLYKRGNVSMLHYQLYMSGLKMVIRINRQAENGRPLNSLNHFLYRFAMKFMVRI